MSGLTKNSPSPGVSVKSASVKRQKEQSFTLLETMAAMTMMITVMLHVTGAQGDMIYNSDYARKMTKAMWLAKAVMGKVDYYWDYREFKSLESEGKVDQAKFKEMLVPEEEDYTYSLSIEEWKFPLLDLLQNGGFKSKGEGSEDQEESEEGGASGEMPIKSALKEILGDHILKVATVEVFWPDGAQRNSVRLTYLLTNQRAVDNQIANLEKTYTKLQNQIKSEGLPPPTNDQDCISRNADKPKFDAATRTCVEAPQ